MTKTIEYELYEDWNGEIIEDCNHPVLLEISHIHWKVFDNLSLLEQQELLSLKWLDRTLYIRKKALSLLNTPSREHAANLWYN